MRVSIVIPTLNEEKTIAPTLRSLLNQDYDGKYEIIVVDGNSTDRTKKIVSSFIKKNKNIKLFSETGKPNIARARNIGIKHAKGEIIAFIDAGRVAPRNWLRKIVDCFKRENIEGLGGGFKLPRKKLNAIEKFTGLDKIYRTNQQKKYTDIVCTGNAAFLKRTIKKVGGFDEQFDKRGENTDFCYKVNGKILFKPDIFVYYNDSYNLKKFIKEHFWNGFYYFLVCLKHKHKTLKDDYRKFSFVVQPFFISLFFIFLLFNSYLSLLVLLLFLLVNIKFLKFVSKHSKKMIVPSFFLQGVRMVLWIAGGISSAVCTTIKSYTGKKFYLFFLIIGILALGFRLKNLWVAGKYFLNYYVYRIHEFIKSGGK